MSKKQKPIVIRPYDKKPSGWPVAFAAVLIAGVTLSGMAAYGNAHHAEERERIAAMKPRPGDREAMIHLTKRMREEADGDDWLLAMEAAQRRAPKPLAKGRR